MAADHFCLRWNNYQSNMVSELDILRTEEYLVDVTLCVESQKFRAHKVILSACSPYFRNVFKENPCEHPVVILKDVSPDDVEALLSFVYQGVVYVSEKKLCSFLQTAELLQIKGLVGAASTLNDEQAKAAIAAGQTGSGTGGGNGQSPVKRRKGAPVRIVKQEDGSVGEEPTLGGQLEPDDSSSPQHNDYSHDMMYDMKNEDDEVSNEDSEGEAGLGGGSGDSNGGYPPSGERLGMPVEAEERLGAVQSIPGLGPQPVQRQLSQGLPLQSPVPPQQSSILSGQFQVPVSGQPPLQELLTPPGTESRNGRRPCPLCTKVISNKSNLLKHMRIRHSDAYNPASCNLCNKIFKNKYSLRAHLNIYHKEYIAPPSGGSGGTPPQQPQPQQQQMQVQVQQAGQLAQFPVSSLPGLDQIHQPQYHQLPTGV